MERISEIAQMRNVRVHFERPRDTYAPKWTSNHNQQPLSRGSFEENPVNKLFH